MPAGSACAVATSSSSNDAMRDLILRSMLVAVLAIPLVAARDPQPRRALTKAVLWFVVFNLFYMLALRFLYPVLS